MKLVSAITFVVTLGTAVSAQADKVKLRDLQHPDKKVAIHTWTPLQQYFNRSNDRGEYGYNEAYGAVVLADELGDALSALGRYSLVEACFQSAKPDATAALVWATCGQDVKDVDLGKVEAELMNVDDEDKKQLLADAAKVMDNAKKIGAAVEDAAKTDKGVAAVLALGAAARTEWAAFASKNKDQLALLDKLQDAVRANKEGLGGDCLKTTAAPFQKLVHASKPPWDEDGDIMDFYYRHLPATTEAYVTILSYAACVLTLTTKGRGPYTVAANRPVGGVGMARRGPRSLAVAKANEESFKPKFADRDLSLDTIRRTMRGTLNLTGTDLVSSIGTPTQGKVSKITKKDDEMTTVAFAGDKVEACLQWKETNKVSQVNNGNVSYEKTCVKRGMVDNQTGETEIPTILMTGIAKGVDLIAVFGFPVVAYKTKEKVLTAVWGVAK